VIFQEGRVLLVKHRKAGRDYWMLPGGGVGYGEPLHGALVRELKEETGLDVEPGGLVAAVDSIAPDGSRHVVNLCFCARVLGGKLAAGGDARVVEAAYVLLNTLEEGLLRPDILQELRALAASPGGDAAMYLGARWRD
jgi:ADP-ribose pyrophosphatase YjhB (NUDIX family)